MCALQFWAELFAHKQALYQVSQPKNAGLEPSGLGINHKAIYLFDLHLVDDVEKSTEHTLY